MREYGSVHTCFWVSADISQLSDQAKLLALYLLTGPHTTMLGCFRLPMGYVAEDLQWGLETVSKGLGELFAKGFITHDQSCGWVFVHNFLKWNPIENPNQGKSIKKLFEQVPENSSLFPLLTAVLRQNDKYFDEEFCNRLETLSEPFRNQDQEQDQNQEQDNICRASKSASLPAAKKKPKLPAKKCVNKAFKTQALEILQFLNEKAGRSYRPVDTNLEFIIARLESGATVIDCHQVIAKKTREWKKNPSMVEYLRPATLFDATKFEQYLGELLPEENKQ